jgi:hypothetical protein
MCRRTIDDPLIRMLADKYRLNILRVPRGGISVGDVLVEDGGDLRHLGKFASFFKPALPMPSASTEDLAPVSATKSTAFSVDVAAKPMETFLTALGLPEIATLSAKLSAARDSKVSFEITGATLESIDVVDLGNELDSRFLSTGNALYKQGRSFFVAHSVARATGMNLTFSSEGEVGASLAAEIKKVGGASGKVAVTKKSSTEINVSRSTPLVFGLAVMRLIEETGKDKIVTRLRLDPLKKQHAVRSRADAKDGAPESIPSVLFDSPGDDLFLDVDSLAEV